ncbi:MAG TPA: (d)CMP kinase [Gemmatimonadaceae bacterium]|nr:(d)CMP kinase [Gemmatimonadaceae bacterium]
MTDRAHVVIAIDGPAASGKSSTSQWVAEKLGYLHVDSGSLYRALTASLLRQGAPPERWTPSVMLAQGARISLRAETTSFVTLIDGVSAEEEIRGSLVTSHVSLVARVQEVRQWVNDRVREAASEHDVVVDGRDMGTAVFPDATLKIFLIADPWERARRRLSQRLERPPTEEEIAAETDLLVQRDAKDATQTVQAKDAVVLDTTYLTQAEQVERIVALARAVSHRPHGT